MKAVFPIILAATFTVRQMPNPEGELEPSVQNEVDHALSLAKEWLAAHSVTGACETTTGDLFKTNGLTREKIAIKLISSQRAGGWWITETNSTPTKLAVEILDNL